MIKDALLPKGIKRTPSQWAHGQGSAVVLVRARTARGKSQVAGLSIVPGRLDTKTKSIMPSPIAASDLVFWLWFFLVSQLTCIL